MTTAGASKGSGWLKKNGKSFKDLRDKRLAHIDVKLGRDAYQLQEIKGPD
jgi:hypothetical protein